MPRLDDKTSHFLFTVLLGLLCYFSVGWLSFYLTEFKSFVALDLYFLPSFLIMTIAFCYTLRKERKFRFIPVLERREWIALVIVFISFSVTRLLKIDEMRIWLDEYTQFLYGYQSKGISLVEKSFYEQQPPLDYMLSGLARRIFGVTPFALKFHVVFFSFLFYLILPFCLRLFTKKIIPRYSVVLLLLFCRPLMVYSLEARPLMLSTLFSLLTLSFILHGVNSIDRSSYFAALFSSLIYTTTTGLQPQIFLLVLCIGLSSLRQSRGHSSFKIGLISFVYNIPVLYYLIIYTQKTNQFNSGIFDKLNMLLSTKELTKVFNIVRWDPYLLLIPILIIGSFSAIGILREKEVHLKKVKIFLFSFPFVYVCLYAIVYYSAISWWFSPRYTLNFFSALPFFLVIGLNELLSVKSKTLKTTFCSLLIFLFCFGSYRVMAHPFKWYVESANRTDWKSLYSELNNRVKQGDKLLMFTLADIGNWRGSLFVGEVFYPNEVVKNSTLRNSFAHIEIGAGIFCDSKADYLEPSSGKLYLINDPTRLSSPVDSIFVEGSGTQLVKKFEFMELYSLDMQENTYNTIKRYFDLFLKKYPKVEATTPLLESLLCLELRYGTEESYSHYLDLYSSVQLKQSWSKSGLFFDKNRELTKRIKYFKKKMEEKWN